MTNQKKISIIEKIMIAILSINSIFAFGFANIITAQTATEEDQGVTVTVKANHGMLTPVVSPTISA